MLDWFGYNSKKIDAIAGENLAEKMVSIYKKNTHAKKHMLHIFLKHTQTIVGVMNIWVDCQGHKRVATYLSKDMRRKRYGSEAHKRVLQEICRRNPSIQILVAQTIESDNLASIRSMCSIGFRRVGARRFATPNAPRRFELSQTFMRPSIK